MIVNHSRGIVVATPFGTAWALERAVEETVVDDLEFLGEDTRYLVDSLAFKDQFPQLVEYERKLAVCNPYARLVNLYKYALADSGHWGHDVAVAPDRKFQHFINHVEQRNMKSGQVWTGERSGWEYTRSLYECFMKWFDLIKSRRMTADGYEYDYPSRPEHFIRLECLEEDAPWLDVPDVDMGDWLSYYTKPAKGGEGLRLMTGRVVQAERMWCMTDCNLLFGAGKGYPTSELWEGVQ